MRVTKCKGEGQGSCKRCSDKGKWNRTWMCFLYEIEGYEGCYCRDCVKEIQDTKERNTEQIIKALECCSTREGDCENCPLDKATTMNCQWVLLSLCLDVIKEQQGELTYCYDKFTELEKECLGLSLHNITLKKENKYLRESLADEREHKEDMEGKDGH